MRNLPSLPSVRPAVAVVGRAAVLASALMLGACAQSLELGLGGTNEKPPEALAQMSRPSNELEKAVEYWAKENAKNPRDAKAALNYARNLKALGRKQEALGVLQNTYMFASENREFLSEYGRLALDAGQVNVAAKMLERADDPAKPDWRVISARGTVLAKQNDFKGAIGYFERARELAPAQTSVMNNLAMAYTMDGQAEKAEQLLRQASQTGQEDPRVRQNLALVLGLQGKHDEAKLIRGNFSDDVGQPAPAAVADPAEALVQDANAVAPAAVKPVAVAATTRPQVQPAANAKPMDPDDVIRAAIEADMARNKKPAAPIATATAPKRKPVTATGPAQAPTIINATGLRAAAD
ncbi:MAG: tetratricopeptide repeat protein [Hyphomicrobiaceae bacterium]